MDECGCAGSAVAFGKLHGVLASKPLALPGKNAINIGLAAGNAAAAAAFLTTGDPTTAVAALGATTVLGGVQGAHMTASIGGKMIHLIVNRSAWLWRVMSINVTGKHICPHTPFVEVPVHPHAC